MEPIIWKPQFDTGITSVDEQHRHLVELVNRIVGLERGGKPIDMVAMDAIFGELAEYASYHFIDEENLMDERKVARRHATPHQQQHNEFIQKVSAMWDTRDAQENPVEALQSFLSSWLSKHILEEDQSMARQIKLIAGGMTPEEAYAHELRDA